MKSYKPNITFVAVLIWMVLMVNSISLYADSLIRAPGPLEQIIAEAIAHNHEIKSLQAAIQSMKDEAGFASSLPDPMVGFGILNLPVDSFRLDQEPMTQKQVFVSQKFPWFGKRDLQSQQSILKAQRLGALVKAKKLEIARRLAEHYYDLAFSRYSLAINEQLRKILDQSVNVAETRYASGRGMQADVYQGQIEITRLRNERSNLEKKEKTSGSRILAIMNQETSDNLKAMTTEESIPAFEWGSEKMVAAAYEHNPMLMVRKAEITLSEAGVRLAQKDSYPDVDVRLAYGQRDESRTGSDWADFVSASVSMNIPLWKHMRQDNKVSSRLSEKLSAEQSYRNLTAMLPHQIDVILAEMKNNNESYALYQEKLIPQTEAWAASSLAAYEVGKADFSTMINARMRVLISRQEAQKIFFEILKNRAALEELVGVPIPDLQHHRKGEGDHD